MQTFVNFIGMWLSVGRRRSWHANHLLSPALTVVRNAVVIANIRHGEVLDRENHSCFVCRWTVLSRHRVPVNDTLSSVPPFTAFRQLESRFYSTLEGCLDSRTISSLPTMSFWGTFSVIWFRFLSSYCSPVSYANFFFN